MAIVSLVVAYFSRQRIEVSLESFTSYILCKFRVEFDPNVTSPRKLQLDTTSYNHNMTLLVWSQEESWWPVENSHYCDYFSNSHLKWCSLGPTHTLWADLEVNRKRAQTDSSMTSIWFILDCPDYCRSVWRITECSDLYFFFKSSFVTSWAHWGNFRHLFFDSLISIKIWENEVDRSSLINLECLR